MAVTDTPAEFGYWSADGPLPRIEYAVSVVEEICAEAVEGLYQFRHGGMEIGGVLFGEADGEVVRILAHRPLDCEHAFGPRFVLSDRDRAHLKDLLYAGHSDESLRGLEPVGWYHSHTRSGIELSPRDLEIYDSYFPQRRQVALVVRPESFGPGRAGFFVRGHDGVVHAGPFESEFAVEPRRGAPARPEPAETPSEPEAAPAAEPPAEPETQPKPRRRWVFDHDAAEGESIAEPSLPGFARAQPSALRKRLWMLIPLALVAVAAFGVVQYYRTEGPAEPLSLWVADMGGQLLIEWDRTARPIREARSATIEIVDGKEHSKIHVEAERLRDGSVDYVRRSDVVDVRLRVESPNRQFTEFIRFVGPPVRRGPSAEETEALRQVQALTAEVAELRAKLAAKGAPPRQAAPRAKNGRTH
jgi:proteasome lid subunit RPN8/RPN11